MTIKISLRNKLSASYIFITLVCVCLISILTNVFLNKQFEKYVEQTQEQKNKDLVSTVTMQFEQNGNWNSDMIETIGINALQNGLIIKVKDMSNKMIWDATVHNNGMCQMIIEKMANNLYTHYHTVKGSYFEKPYPVLVNNSQVGVVDIGYYGPFYLNDSDLAFISTL